MNQQTIGFIGGGNMATALVKGLITDGTRPNQLLVAEPDKRRREQLAATLSIRTREDNLSIAREADILVLAVKPQVLREVAREISEQLRQSRPLVISIAAGIRHQDLQRWLGEEVSLVRAMPNTPAMVQSGATGLYAGQQLTEDQRMAAERVMRATGLTRWVEDEAQIDAVTAISGSGPAYFFLFMEALEASGRALGLPAETARLLTLQTALGAAKMALESEASIEELRAQVTSPGGTTEQAIRTFEEGNLRKLVLDAATAARDKSIDLSAQLGKD